MRKIAILLFSASLATCRHRVAAEDLDADTEGTARAYLACPRPAEIQIEMIRFGRNNKQADPHRWGEMQISGCERSSWCGSPRERFECLPPPDLDMALRQLSVETGCPPQSMHQLQHVAMGNRGAQDGDEIRSQATYRIDACGQFFACTIPLFAPYDNETLVPVLGEGAMIMCKPVATPQAGAPVPSAPPPTAP